MQIALMIPCYIDLFFPDVGVATLELLEKFNMDVVYPADQTCCGQPMANSGCYEEVQATEELFIENFSLFDCIVTPSGSCTHHFGVNRQPPPVGENPARKPNRDKLADNMHPLFWLLSSCSERRPGTLWNAE